MATTHPQVVDDTKDKPWHLMDHLKTAFKDESTISNIPMPQSIQGHVTDLLQTPSPPPPTTTPLDENQDHLKGLITVDEELSFHSCVMSPGVEDERYIVQRTLQTFLNPSTVDTTPQFPGIIDVSSIYEDGLGIQNISFDTDGDGLGLMNLTNLNQSSKIDLNKDDLLEDDGDLLMATRTGDSASLGDITDDEGTLSTDGSSMIFNIWNEDYEGNPDPTIMKRLVESKKLPRRLDPLVKTAVRRQRVLAELKEIEDDESSNGSCNVLIGKMCLCGDRRDVDNDSLVDTIIQIDTGSTMDETASAGGSVDFADLIIRTAKGKKTKRLPKELASQYKLMSDKQYRPGVKPTDLIMMLPSTSIQPTKNVGPVLNPHLPVDRVKRIDDDLLKTGTYDEKDQEFTLQHYDSTPNRIAELVMAGKRSDATNYDISKLKDQSEVVDAFVESPNFDLEALKLTEKRMPIDYDPIDGDRSILSPSEVEAEKEEFLAYLAERESEEKRVDNFQSQILQMFSDTQEQSQAKVTEDLDVQSVKSTESINPAASNEENCSPVSGDSRAPEEKVNQKKAEETTLGTNKPGNRSVLSACGQGFAIRCLEDKKQESGEDSQEQAPVSAPVVPVMVNKKAAAAFILQTKVEKAVRGDADNCICNPMIPPGIEEVEDLMRLLDMTVDSDISNESEGEGEEVVMAMPVVVGENTAAVPVIYPASSQDSSGRFGIVINPCQQGDEFEKGSLVSSNKPSPLIESLDPIEKPTMELDFESNLEKDIIAQSPDEFTYDNIILQPAELREDNNLSATRLQSTEDANDDNFSDASSGVESVSMEKKPEKSVGACDGEMADISNGYESVKLPVSEAKNSDKKKKKPEKQSKKKHDVSDDLNDLRNVLKSKKSTPMKTKHAASMAKNSSLLDSISSGSRPELNLDSIAH